MALLVVGKCDKFFWGLPHRFTFTPQKIRIEANWSPAKFEFLCNHPFWEVFFIIIFTQPFVYSFALLFRHRDKRVQMFTRSSAMLIAALQYHPEAAWVGPPCSPVCKALEDSWLLSRRGDGSKASRSKWNQQSDGMHEERRGEAGHVP